MKLLLTKLKINEMESIVNQPYPPLRPVQLATSNTRTYMAQKTTIVQLLTGPTKINVSSNASNLQIFRV
jgi:hypothetical protein